MCLRRWLHDRYARRAAALSTLHELVTSGVAYALHWALAFELRRRTCSGSRCSSDWLARRHEPSGRIRPRGPGKRGHRGHPMRSRPWVRLRSPIIVAMATSRRGGLIHRSTGPEPVWRLGKAPCEYVLRSLRVGKAGRASTQSYFIFRAQAITKLIIWLEKECIFQSFDQNKVHFNQNLGSKSSAFQASESKAVKSSAAPQVPPRTWQGTQGGLRRAWLRRTRDEGGTTNAASESSAGEVVAPA